MKSDRKFGRTAVTAVVALLSLTSGCCKRPALPDGPQLEKIFQTEGAAAAKPQPPKSVPVRELDVYIDGSYSMAGYVSESAGQSQYRRVLHHILDASTTAQYKLSAYKFANDITPVNHMEVSQILSPGFYNGTDTPLNLLLDRIGRQDYAGHLSIILSDMVQSEVAKDQLEMVDSLSRLVTHRPEVRLLAFRSSFTGPYYIESIAHSRKQKQQSYPLNLGQSIPGIGRPFYLLVVAPDRQSMDRLQRYVLDHASAAESFSPTDAPVGVRAIEFAPADGAPSIWSQHAQSVLSESGASAQHMASFVEVHAPAGKDSPLRLKLGVNLRVPMEAIDKINLQVRKAVLDSNGASKPVSFQLPVTLEGKPVGETGQLIFTYQVERPGACNWELYHVQMRAGDGNLACPRWVQDWSTDDDQYPSAGTRTFKLKLLVEAMVRGITEKNVFCEQYLAVRRGD